MKQFPVREPECGERSQIVPDKLDDIIRENETKLILENKGSDGLF
jgi:hypothetical protein